MQKINKKASILILSIILSLTLSIIFISISNKINLNLKQNIFLTKNEENEIVEKNFQKIEDFSLEIAPKIINQNETKTEKILENEEEKLYEILEQSHESLIFFKNMINNDLTLKPEYKEYIKNIYKTKVKDEEIKRYDYHINFLERNIAKKNNEIEKLKNENIKNKEEEIKKIKEEIKKFEENIQNSENQKNFLDKNIFDIFVYHIKPKRTNIIWEFYSMLETNKNIILKWEEEKSFIILPLNNYVHISSNSNFYIKEEIFYYDENLELKKNYQNENFLDFIWTFKTNTRIKTFDYYSRKEKRVFKKITLKWKKVGELTKISIMSDDLLIFENQNYTIWKFYWFNNVTLDKWILKIN